MQVLLKGHAADADRGGGHTAAGVGSERGDATEYVQGGGGMESEVGDQHPEVEAENAGGVGSAEERVESRREAVEAGEADGTGALWSAGKERLLARLMAEGFSREASLRAMIAISQCPAGAVTGSVAARAANAGLRGREQNRQGSMKKEGGGVVSGRGRGAPKSTAKVAECILWLCERLGDASINDELSEGELAQLSLTENDLPRLNDAVTEHQSQAEAAVAEAAAAVAETASAKRVFYKDAAVEDAINAAAKAAAAREAAAAAAADPWRVLEKASEEAAVEAAKQARKAAVEEQRARELRQLRGFNKGYKT
jgi:hypothetical protein